MTTTMNVMDICSYCEVATESIQKSIENGNFDGALVQFSAYLLEVHSRLLNGEIGMNTWYETLRFYRRMAYTVIDEYNLQQTIHEREEK